MYQNNFRLNDIQDIPDQYYIQTDYELSEVLDYVGFPEEYRKDITSALVVVFDADYEAVFLSESARPYDLNSWYQPLPYYLPEDWINRRNLPVYWLESNEYYQV
jgi:hypothetical protein